MTPFEYSQSTLNWIKAAEERELEKKQEYLKRSSITEDDYIKFLDILAENLEGFYFTTISGKYYGEQSYIYSWWYEEENRVVHNSADNLDNDFTTARELVEDIVKYLKEKL